MAIPSSPKIVKWPFVLADFVLVASAFLMAWRTKWSFPPLTVLGLTGCIIVGAVLMVVPFLMEHMAAVKLWEQSNLADAAQQLDQWVTCANRMTATTSHWQETQAASQKASESARQLVDRISAEAKAFSDFLQRTELQEKQSLRFELEKVRRQEGELLQVMVHLLDHTFGLWQAGERSGQPQLAQQLSHFRSACLETARRVGLVAYEAVAGSPFDPQAHQTADGQEPPPGSVISTTVATGYTFQGQPVRRILVTIQEPPVAITSPPDRSTHE